MAAAAALHHSAAGRRGRSHLAGAGGVGPPRPAAVGLGCGAGQRRQPFNPFDEGGEVLQPQALVAVAPHGAIWQVQLPGCLHAPGLDLRAGIASQAQGQPLGTAGASPLRRASGTAWPHMPVALAHRKRGPAHHSPGSQSGLQLILLRHPAPLHQLQTRRSQARAPPTGRLEHRRSMGQPHGVHGPGRSQDQDTTGAWHGAISWQGAVRTMLSARPSQPTPHSCPLFASGAPSCLFRRHSARQALS